MCVFRSTRFTERAIRDLLPVKDWEFPPPAKLSKDVLVAFRRWDIDPDGHLRSPNMRGRWEPDALKLAGLEGMKPSRVVGIGVYAYHDANMVNFTGKGEVTLLGTVLEFTSKHETTGKPKGYMAEAGYPRAVYIQDDLVRAKAERLYPDVEFFAEDIWK